MPITYNVYCDESCHLEHDGINVMGLGAIWCDSAKVHHINTRISEIKKRNGVFPHSEAKWSKVAPVKLQLYQDLVNYFFDDDDLHFRVLIVPDKTCLDHERFSQTHDEWYYKMYFEMLKVIFSPSNRYCVYIDIKDSHSTARAKKLHEVCCNDKYDFSHQIIRRIQPIRSNEIQIMQLVDILLGATTYTNRSFTPDAQQSAAKHTLMSLIRERSGYTMRKTTLLREEKYNMLLWRANA